MPKHAIECAIRPGHMKAIADVMKIIKVRFISITRKPPENGTRKAVIYGVFSFYVAKDLITLGRVSKIIKSHENLTKCQRDVELSAN